MTLPRPSEACLIKETMAGLNGFHLPRLGADEDRPRTRSDCAGGPRPCPYISCRYHLYLDADPVTGRVKVYHPEVAPDELELLQDTCALDVADRGPQRLENIAQRMDVTRERVRQFEAMGLALGLRRAHKLGIEDPTQ